MSMTRFNLLSGLILAGLACVTSPLSAQSTFNKLTTRVISIREAQPAKDVEPVIPISESCPERTPCWSIYADALYWTSRGDTTPYGQIRDGVIIVPGDVAAAVPRGPVASVDSYYSPGFRVGGTALLTSCVEADVNFTWWQNRSTDTLSIPGNLPAPFILPLAADFRALNAANIVATVANARQDVHLLMGDAVVKYTFCGSECNALKFVAGGRYTHLDQNFQVYYFSQESFRVQSNINFDGFGPKVGLEGGYTVWGGFFVWGRTDLSLIYGHFGADYLMQSDIAGEMARTRSGDDRVVPILETELALGWRSCNKRVEVMLGYTASNWFNTLTTPGWIESVQQDAFAQNRSNQQTTLSFDGLFARVALKF